MDMLLSRRLREAGETKSWHKLEIADKCSDWLIPSLAGQTLTRGERVWSSKLAPKTGWLKNAITICCFDNCGWGSADRVQGCT